MKGIILAVALLLPTQANTAIGSIVEHCFTKTGACFIQVFLDDAAAFYATRTSMRFKMYDIKEILLVIPEDNYTSLKVTTTHKVNYNVDHNDDEEHEKRRYTSRDNLFDLVTSKTTFKSAAILASLIASNKGTGTFEIIHKGSTGKHTFSIQHTTPIR